MWEGTRAVWGGYEECTVVVCGGAWLGCEGAAVVIGVWEE